MSEFAKLFIKYCPVYYFYKDEPYMPCNFDDMMKIANVTIEDLNTIKLINIPREKRFDHPIATQILCKTDGYIKLNDRTYIDLVYVITFTWNGTLLEHSFDKEETVIRLLKYGDDSYEIVKIFGSSHGYGKWWDLHLIDFDEETRKPILYAANESHAIYNEPRIYKGIFSFGNDVCGRDKKWIPTEFVVFENNTVNIYDINMNIIKPNVDYFKYEYNVGDVKHNQQWAGSLNYNTLNLDGFYPYIGGIDGLFTGEKRKINYKHRYALRVVTGIIMLIFLGYLLISNVVKSRHKGIIKKFALFILQILIFAFVFISSAYISWEIFIISPINEIDINKSDSFFVSVNKILTKIFGF